MKIKENVKKYLYLHFARDLKKYIEHESYGDTNCSS